MRQGVWDRRLGKMSRKLMELRDQCKDAFIDEERSGAKRRVLWGARVIEMDEEKGENLVERREGKRVR